MKKANKWHVQQWQSRSLTTSCKKILANMLAKIVRDSAKKSMKKKST